MEEDIQTKQEGFKLVEVATQMGLAIQTPEGKRVSEAELLIILANKILKLEKAIAG